MVQNPFLILLILILIVAGADHWHRRFEDSKVLRYFPTPVLCYVPPTILTTIGILPPASGIYDWITHLVLPACLILLLMTTNLPALKRIGQLALMTMACATASVIAGAVACFILFQGWLGAESWKAIGTITGSWIGGTANMVAVKQATALSDHLFVPLFISDITVVYVWMTLLMILSSKQNALNRFIHADQNRLERAISEIEAPDINQAKLVSKPTPLLLALGFGLGALCSWLGSQIPEIGLIIHRGTWVIILVTTLGLVLSFTPLAHAERASAGKLGYYLLFLVLAATGAKANLLAIFRAPLFLVIGFCWLAFHSASLLAVGRWLKIPVSLLATASQANLGGVASAPIVASTFDRRLVPVALVLAILGNAAGNYLGIATAYLLRTLT